MTFYQLAFRYLKRKKAKTVLLFFVLLIVSSMILSTNMILRATADSKTAIGEKTKAKVVMEILKEDDRITPDDVEWIKDLEEVSTVNCLAKNDAFPVNFQLVTGSDSTEASNQKASLLSYDNLENDSGFSEGVYRLVSGSYIAGDIKGIVINSYLADANQLKLGDLIELETTNGKRVSLEIVGIFLSGNESKQPERMDSVNRIENQLFIDHISYSDLFEMDGYAKVAVYCKNPEQLNLLEEELNSYLSDKADSTTSDTLYQQMALPLEQITRAAKLMLALTLLAGTVIVSLLLCMWMRTRVTIKDGRMITEEDTDVCVISEELADKNNLSVGSRIQFNDRRDVENGTVFGAEIVGIYRVQQKMTPVMSRDTYRSENIIFTDLGFPEKAEGSTSGALRKSIFQSGRRKPIR